jgi:hypothetical protein
MRSARWILVLLVALWAVDAVLGLGTFWSHDLRHQHIPWRVWAASEWAQGHVPLWNPDVGNGFPLAADGQTGVFYLPNMLLFGLLPVAAAVNISVLGHIGFAAEGMRRLMNALGTRGPGALLGAVAFAFSGFMSTHIGYLGMQNAAAWLPWLVAAAIAGRWAPIGLCAGMMMVAGHPQIAIIGLIAAAAVALWQGHLRMFLVGTLVAGLAASPQLLATAELLGSSMRRGGVTDAFAHIGALPVAELVNGVLPTFFGLDRPADIAQSYFHRGDGYWGQGANHWEMSFYLGVVVVILAVLGARGQRFWLGLAGVAILLMVGSPLWDGLRLLPIFDSMRFPVRFSLWLTLAVAVLAGKGLEVALNHPRPRALAWTLAGIASLFAGGLAVGGSIFDRVRPALGDSLLARYAGRAAGESSVPLTTGTPDLSAPEAAVRVQQILSGAADSLDPMAPANLLAVGLVVAFAVLMYARSNRWLSTPLLALALLGLSYGDLWHFGADYNPRTPIQIVNQTPAAVARLGTALTKGRVAVVDRRRHPSLDKELISSNLGLQYGLADVLVPSPLLNLRNEALLEKTGLDIGSRGAHKWRLVEKHLPLISMMGVRWLFSEHATDGGLFSTHMRQPVYVYENKAAMPREFLVWCVEISDDPWAALDTLNPAVFAIVERDVGIAECRTPMSEGTVSTSVDEPHLRVLHVDTAAPALLVQAESFAPGWVAAIDGEPADIHRVNWTFRGVVVPPGHHIVEFKYQPEWLSASLPVSVLAWLGLLLGLALRQTGRVGEE